MKCPTRSLLPDTPAQRTDLSLWHASCFHGDGGTPAERSLFPKPTGFREFAVQGVWRRYVRDCQVYPRALPKFPAQGSKTEPRNGEPPSVGRCARDTESGSTRSEDKRGTSSVLGRDGMWQGTWRGTRGRIRPVPGRHRSVGKAPAMAVPGLPGHGERQRGFAAKSGPPVGRGSVVTRTCRRSTAPANGGNGATPIPPVPFPCQSRHHRSRSAFVQVLLVSIVPRIGKPLPVSSSTTSPREPRWATLHSSRAGREPRLAAVHPEGDEAPAVSEGARNDRMTVTVVSLTMFTILKELFVPAGDFFLSQVVR
jgi:hypothetical protein